MTKREKIITAVFLICVLALFAGAYALRRGDSGMPVPKQRRPERIRSAASSQEPITETAFKLNTVVTISIYDSQDTSLLDGCMELWRPVRADVQPYPGNQRAVPAESRRTGGCRRRFSSFP